MVRFGVMKIDDLRDAVGRCFRALGFYGLSFYGENGLSPQEIALLARKPHSLMRKTRVSRIRREGFEIERYGRFPHLTLRFSQEPSNDDLRRLVGVFDEAESNPHPVE